MKYSLETRSLGRKMSEDEIKELIKEQYKLGTHILTESKIFHTINPRHKQTKIDITTHQPSDSDLFDDTSMLLIYYNDKEWYDLDIVWETNENKFEMNLNQDIVQAFKRKSYLNELAGLS